MKVFLIILLIIALLPAVFFVIAFVANALMITTGKLTREELAIKAEKYNAQKKARKNAKKAKICCSLSDFTSYPSPLNYWGLWH